ncbi:hypothetical protein N7492_004805 [Penicillium capsulatum]|uniref:Mitochondrial export translocase Oxa2 n=1 Tax=Penicillium capsulatum TaxID=69766 RepID=A0A9W9LQJ8_9EURO|nr:hypothetical protein N7492_004805 [Penicillium capsulatum]KAJ6136086.1 hypothetical protein N7512_001246 [Penicillium capsulatum]
MNSLSTPALRVSRRALPHCRIRPQVRFFHPTRPTRLVQEALDASTGLFCGVHSLTGLPWVASIPLTALLVRTVVGLPLQIFTRIHARRERDIQPLIRSWQLFHEREAKAKKPTENPKVVAMKDSKVSQKRLRLRWKVATGYQLAGILQLPVWLSLVESLRAMSGTGTAVLDWVVPFMSSSETYQQERLEHAQHLLQPTMASEGAFWFPDLLAGDPSGTLPLLLAASILVNIQSGWRALPGKEIAEMNTAQMYQSSIFRALRITVQLLALNVGLSGYIYQMPASLMIYWISSSNIATLQTFLLERYMFVKPPIPPYAPKAASFNQPNAKDPFKLRLV